MRVCLAQINTTPGDFDGNLARIQEGINRAQASGCDVVVFPELAIPGYLSQDLMYHDHFLSENQRALQSIKALSAKSGFERLLIVVGYLERNTRAGKPLFNAAAGLLGGEQCFNHRKNLLPFYDVFDEQRYFESGSELTHFNFLGVQLGIAICEDLWNDKGESHYPSGNNPLARYQAAGTQILLSLNSSPYVHDKLNMRQRVISENLGDMSLVYVNQWGGQDELVFDGQSFVMAQSAIIHQSTKTFEDDFAVVDCPTPHDPLPAAVLPKPIALYDLLVTSVRDYAEKSGFEQLVIASSGGIDSALVIQIACDAVGPKKVHAIRMPSIFSSKGAHLDAVALHERLGCWDYEMPIAHEHVVADLNRAFSNYDDPDNLVHQIQITGRYNAIADQNMQARLRDIYLMHFSNAFGALALSTGNKTESACGYYTHFDMNFGFAPLKDLYKHQVFSLAAEGQRIPAAILTKPPSAELAPDQTDEASLLPYSVLDPLVQAYIEDYVNRFEDFQAWVVKMSNHQKKTSSNDKDLKDWLDDPASPEAYSGIIRLISMMEFKRRQTCPGPKVSKVAFGMGRRIPIVKKYI